jgi:hypothetical protein
MLATDNAAPDTLTMVAKSALLFVIFNLRL